MAIKYNQPSLSSAVRFERAPLAELEFSKMFVNPRVYTTYNAGDIVPVYYEEILPHSTFSIDLEFINRLLSATIKPTMGSMQMDVFAFFVPNRIVNESWKNVQGENTSGYWSAPEVKLAPLYPMAKTADVSVPPLSVADYYGFPTQAPIKAEVLQQCNDFLGRGYLSIYNNYFRDENYQPPIPFSTLNVYNGFFEPVGNYINFTGAAGGDSAVSLLVPSDGTFVAGAINKSLFGEGYNADNAGEESLWAFPGRLSSWSMLDRPLKANKLHDAFTSVLPSPQKGPEVFFGIGGLAPVVGHPEFTRHSTGQAILSRDTSKGNIGIGTGFQLFIGQNGDLSKRDEISIGLGDMSQLAITDTTAMVDLSQAAGVSINDLRTAASIQQVYEMLARGGSRYLESLRSFFGIDSENPFKNIPTQLGHLRYELDLYQVAQTSGSVEGETPQGNLTGFGYTTKQGNFFTYTALEHGYIHYMAVVRHRNIYPALMMPDKFRLSTLDWYLPQLANIGEQPIKLATLNPFVTESMEKTIGFQEAWWEYRYSPDRLTGYCRTGLNDSLDIWTYADQFNPNFEVVDGAWLRSDSQEVLDRTLAVTSALSPQFLCMFEFKTTKQIPMPIYSVPGLDVL